MGRAPCSKLGLHRGHWSEREDTLLTTHIQTHGEGQWRSLPKKAELLRSRKSCRLRWMNHLKPGIKRGNITPDEDDLIIQLHTLLGNRWSLIAGRLPGRTDNEIKNYWHTHLIKRLKIPTTQPNFSKQVKKLDLEPKKRKKMTPTTTKGNTADGDVMATKIYQPKPTRPLVSSVSFTLKNDSISNLPSCSKSFGKSDDYGKIQVCDEDPEGVISGCDLSTQHSLLINDKMLAKLYDEYLQLL